MQWMKGSQRLAAFWLTVGLTAACTLLSASLAPVFTPALADIYPKERIIVLRSTVPGIESGDVLEEGQIVVLPAGANLALMSDRGDQAELEGPFSGPVRVRGPRIALQQLDAMNAALSGRDAQRWTDEVERRDAERVPTVYVDVDQGGTWCVFNGSRTYLMRSDLAAETVTLIDVKSGQRTPFDWRSFNRHRAWPASLPLPDGAVYRLRRPGYDTVDIEIRRLDNRGKKVANLFAMAELGCRTQFERGVQILSPSTVAGVLPGVGR